MMLKTKIMSIDFVSWDEIEKLKIKTFLSRKKSFFFEMRNAKWKCLLEWDKMLEKRFWFLSTCDYFRSKMFFYQRNVSLYSRDVFMYSKKCLFILILLLCVLSFILLINYEFEQQNDKYNSTFIFIQKLSYVIVSAFF
jgi:hypothetical protein